MESKFYIWSCEHQQWWKANKQGYTHEAGEAGVYGAEDSEKIITDSGKCKEGFPNEIRIPEEDIFLYL